MTKIINKLTKEYEGSGYAVAKNTFDGWLSSKKDITQKDEATVKLFMAHLCLAQDKLDDLQEFFNTGMSQAEKEELESLKSKVQELEKENESLRLQNKEYEQIKVKLEEEKARQGTVLSPDYEQVGKFLMLRNYWRGPFYGYVNASNAIKNYKKVLGYSLWRLPSEEEFKTLKPVIGSEDCMVFFDSCIINGMHFSIQDIGKKTGLYICPVCEKL